MVCSKCGKILPEGVDMCADCGAKGYVPRPGGKAFVSPEGIIHSTDGKYRWVYETNLWRDPAVLAGTLIKFALVGALVGLMAVSTLGPLMPLLLGLVGALAGLGVHAANALANGGRRCVLYTLDGDTVCAQQVEGRADKQKVMRVVSQWVGGQSYPELTFRRPEQTRLKEVSALRPDVEHSCIRLSGAGKVKRLQMEPGQFAFVLEHLKRCCTGVK